MEDVESERRNSRRKRKLSARHGVVIGVAAVAGLGLMTKLVSFLRREKPKKISDEDIETLEAVLSGDAAKSALPSTKEVRMFANLENDEPDHEVVNGYEASPPNSKDADPLPEVAKNGDVTQDGEKNVIQDLVADKNTLTAEESEPSPVIQATVKGTPHSNGEEVEVNQGNEDTPHIDDEGKPELQNEIEVKPQVEDEAKHLNGDALEALVEDATKVNTQDEGKHVSEDAVELPIKDEKKHHDEDAVELQSEDALEQLIEDAGKVDSEDKGTLSIEDAAPTKVVEQHQVEDDGNLHSEEAESIQS